MPSGPVGLRPGKCESTRVPNSQVLLSVRLVPLVQVPAVTDAGARSVSFIGAAGICPVIFAIVQEPSAVVSVGPLTSPTISNLCPAGYMAAIELAGMASARRAPRTVRTANLRFI
jgi:hypothetical protein